MEKVLVTGGAGFIGSHIVDLLVERGYSVVILDNLSSGSLYNVNPKAKFHQMDIRDQDVLDVFKEENFAYVIHQAAQTTVKASLEDPCYDASVNILGTVNILEACRKTGVKRVIYASSAAVYGNSADLPLQEDSRGDVSSFYGLSKQTVEYYLQLYQKNFNLEYIILRYSNVYGPRQRADGEGGVIGIFLEKLRRSFPPTIYGTGEQTRDFVYVKDVALANLACLESEQANLCLNISTGQGTSIKHLVTILNALTGKEMNLEYKPQRQGDIHQSILSNSLAAKKILWQPTLLLVQGLSELLKELL